MLSAVQAHADVLCQYGVPFGVLIPIFPVKLPCAAPSRRTVLFAGPLILFCGKEKQNRDAVGNHCDQHEFQSMSGPA